MGSPLKLFLVASYQFLGTYDLKYYVDAGDGYAEGIGKDPETHLYPEHAKSSKEIGIVEVKGKVFHAITFSLETRLTFNELLKKLNRASLWRIAD